MPDTILVAEVVLVIDRELLLPEPFFFIGGPDPLEALAPSLAAAPKPELLPVCSLGTDWRRLPSNPDLGLTRPAEAVDVPPEVTEVGFLFKGGISSSWSASPSSTLERFWLLEPLPLSLLFSSRLEALALVFFSLMLETESSGLSHRHAGVVSARTNPVLGRHA